MDFDKSILHPPDFDPIAYEEYMASLPPPNNNGIKNVELKYTLTEAKLRILSCCRDLGISETNDVKYHQVQKAYELKFGTPLNKEELKHLFLCRKATNALKENVEDFLVVIENEDKIMRLRLKENSEDLIKDMEKKYDGEAMPSLTPEQIHEILNPTLYENVGSTNRRPYYGPPRTYDTSQHSYQHQNRGFNNYQPLQFNNTHSSNTYQPSSQHYNESPPCGFNNYQPRRFYNTRYDFQDQTQSYSQYQGPPRGFNRYGYQRFNSTQLSSGNEDPPQRYNEYQGPPRGFRQNFSQHLNRGFNNYEPQRFNDAQARKDYQDGHQQYNNQASYQGPPRGFQRHGYQRFNSTQFSNGNEDPPQRYYNQPSYSNNSYVPSHGFLVPPPRPQRPQAYRPPLSPDATCVNISAAAAISAKIQDIPSNADSTNHPKKLKPIISNKQKKNPKLEEKKEAKRIRFENATKRLEGYLAEVIEEFEADYKKVKTECGGTITQELQNEYDMKVQHLHDLHNCQIDSLYKIIIEGKWDV